MKIAHLADIHYCPKHLYWVDTAMQYAVDEAIKRECDLMVISGDYFDHAMGMHEPAAECALRQLIEVAEQMPLVLLNGTLSHDRPGTLNLFKQIPTKHQILVADEPGTWVFNSKDANESMWNWDKWGETEITESSLIVHVLPSINKADAKAKGVSDKEFVQQQMDVFGERSKAANVVGAKIIMSAHGYMVGCLTESNHAIVSPDHELTEEILYSSGAEITMLGHIHKHQTWIRGEQSIAYSGSIARLVHNDHTYKGLIIWDLDDGGHNMEFIQTPTRMLYEIEFDGTPNMDEITELATQANENDAVRIRWTVKEEAAAAVDKDSIRAMFKHCDSIKLEPRIIPVQHVRAKGITARTSLADKLDMWIDTNHREHQTDALQDRLDILQQSSTQSIVSSIVRL